MLIITGNLHAKSLAVGSDANIWIGGNLELEEYLFVDTSDAGSICVGGKTKSESVFLTGRGLLHLGEDPVTCVISDEIIDGVNLCEEMLVDSQVFTFRELIDSAMAGYAILRSDTKDRPQRPHEIPEGIGIGNFSKIKRSKAMKAYGLDIFYGKDSPRMERPKKCFLHEGSIILEDNLFIRDVDGPEDVLYIIDGNLTVGNVLDLESSYMGGWALHVTGDVIAKSCCIRDHAGLTIAGNLIVQDYILAGDHQFHVEGDVRAKAIISDGVFPYFSTKPLARIIVRDPGFFERQLRPGNSNPLPKHTVLAELELSANAIPSNLCLLFHDR